MKARRLIFVIILFVGLTCNVSVAESNSVFKVDVIVDTSSESVSYVQTRHLFKKVNEIMVGLTSVHFKMVKFVKIARTGTIRGLISSYVRRAKSHPNGILIFSFGDNNQALTFGGYSYITPAPPKFRNTFASPVVGVNYIYVAVVHWEHRYARCGYGDLERPVSATSIDGECRNQSGTPCVIKYGYQMCANAVNNLYASHPLYFTAASVIHEFLHPFGYEGNYDHYGTQKCTSHMQQGISKRAYSENFNMHQSQYYNVMCPYLYDNFERSYQPLPAPSGMQIIE